MNWGGLNVREDYFDLSVIKLRGKGHSDTLIEVSSDFQSVEANLRFTKEEW
jgi:hypothetical protein